MGKLKDKLIKLLQKSLEDIEKAKTNTKPLSFTFFDKIKEEHKIQLDSIKESDEIY
jgi:hypothetical protein